TALYTLSLHDALPIFIHIQLRGGIVEEKTRAMRCRRGCQRDLSQYQAGGDHLLLATRYSVARKLPIDPNNQICPVRPDRCGLQRSEEHTSELQSRENL